MELKDYVVLLVAFVLSYVMMLYTRKYVTYRKFLRPFVKQGIFDEQSAKKYNDIFLNSQQSEVKLIPYLNYFREQIIQVTPDNRLFMNYKKFKNKRLKTTIIPFGIISLLCLLLFFLLR